MKEKILTRDEVIKLGLDKVQVITADMLEGYTSIGENAFFECITLISVIIGNNVTSIEDGAFSGCTNLTSVTISNSVVSIGNYVFCNCKSLTSIIIPNSVIRIGNYAFQACNSLTSVSIPNSVTSIGWHAFNNCTGLISVVILNNVISIGYGVFFNCISLTSLTIVDKTYEKQAVINSKCKAYKAFNGDMTCLGFKYEENKTYEFEGEPELCVCGFHACLNLSDVFNYYRGEIGKNIVVYEVELEGISNECNEYDSKVVAKKITIGKRIL